MMQKPLQIEVNISQKDFIQVEILEKTKDLEIEKKSNKKF